MNVITRKELFSSDYEWFREYINSRVPIYDKDSGRTVFTYLRDGYFCGYCQLELTIQLRVSDNEHKALIYYRSYDTKGETLSLEYDYQEAVEIEKIIMQNYSQIILHKISKRHDHERTCFIDGYDSFIMFNSGDTISWKFSIPDEWKTISDCVKRIFNYINSKYPICHEEKFYTDYETRLYSCASSSGKLFIKNSGKIHLIRHWCKCYDEDKHKPVIKLYYNNKMLVIYLSLDQRDKLEKDLNNKRFINLSDYKIESAAVCQTDNN
ncbi:MAG: hypothetical protein IJ446_07620 [Oscillospiraceae bacterium]|nr:hypothetical protein [Oscillospiraceae bacterium]